MATAPLTGIKLVQNIYGMPQPVFNFKEATSQTYKAGDLVYLSGGYVTVCGTDPTLILGMVLQDGNNLSTAGTEATVPVMLLNGGVFEMNVSTVTAVTTVGTLYGIVASSNKWSVDISETSNTKVNVVALSDKDTVGDTYGRVRVMFIDKYLQLTGGNI